MFQKQFEMVFYDLNVSAHLNTQDKVLILNKLKACKKRFYFFFFDLIKNSFFIF